MQLSTMRFLPRPTTTANSSGNLLKPAALSHWPRGFAGAPRCWPSDKEIIVRPCCAWADGASFNTDGHRQAGIGGLLVDSDGTVIEHISRPIGEEDAFAAELAALIAVIQSATERQQKRLWLYTDNRGLVQLWNEHRGDKRLNELRRQAASLERIALRAIPRLHNQPANALARAAIKARASLGVGCHH
jgi:ribonuclease HI